MENRFCQTKWSELISNNEIWQVCYSYIIVWKYPRKNPVVVEHVTLLVVWSLLLMTRWVSGKEMVAFNQ